MTLQEAIKRQEGPNSRHNPGNIINGSFAKSHGALPSTSFLATFPDDVTGMAALTALLHEPDYINLDVEHALFQYLGLHWGGPDHDAQGDSAAIYVKDVCQWCNCQPTTPIKSLLGA